MQHGDGAGDGADEFHVVFDDNHRVFAGQAFQKFAGAFHFLAGHPGDGFIHQQQLWFLHQHHADFQPLLLSVGKQARHLVSVFKQTHGGQSVLDPVCLFAA